MMKNSNKNNDFTGTSRRAPRDGMTAYGRLAALFREKIASGKWDVGHRLPNVADLAKMYGVSPVTVRGAIGLLADDGLIFSRQGRGTFVTDQLGEGPGDILRTAFGDNYFVNWLSGPQEEFQTLERGEGELPPELADGAPVYGEYVYLRRIYARRKKSGDVFPLCLVDFYIAKPAYESLSTDLDRSLRLGMQLLTKAEPRAVRGRQITTVGLAPSPVCELLDLPVGSPIVNFYRRFLDREGRAVGAAIHQYPSIVYRQVIDQTAEEILENFDLWSPSRHNEAEIRK